MKLGVIPAPNSGLWSMQKTGQLERLFRHLGYYAEHFDLRYITWGDYESESRLWKPFQDKTGAQLVHASVRMEALMDCDVLRCMNLHATMAAMPTFRPFVMSYGADYPAIAKIHGRPAWKWKLLRAVAIRRARAVLVPNESMAYALMQRYPNATIRHHPNWVDCEMFAPSENPEPYQWGVQDRIVLYVGRLVKEKNLLALADAVAGISGLAFWCIGEGPLLGELMRRGAICIGPKEWRDLPVYYRHADVFVLPSLSEGHPKALTEAMACGVPCIVSNAVTEGSDAVMRTDDFAKGLDWMLTRRGATDVYGRWARGYAVEHWDVKMLMPREIEYLKAAARG